MLLVPVWIFLLIAGHERACSHHPPIFTVIAFVLLFWYLSLPPYLHRAGIIFTASHFIAPPTNNPIPGHIHAWEARVRFLFWGIKMNYTIFFKHHKISIIYPISIFPYTIFMPYFPLINPIIRLSHHGELCLPFLRAEHAWTWWRTYALYPNIQLLNSHLSYL